MLFYEAWQIDILSKVFSNCYCDSCKGNVKMSSNGLEDKLEEGHRGNLF